MYYATEDFGRFQPNSFDTARSNATRFDTSQFQTARSKVESTLSMKLSMNRRKKQLPKMILNPSLDSFEEPMPDIEIADYTDPTTFDETSNFNEYNSPYISRKMVK